MDEKLTSALNKIEALCKQNAEFDTELRKRLSVAPSANVESTYSPALNEIYEYCIERVIREQAHGFYDGFPLTSKVERLIDDYCRMETFRRKNNFGDFCLALYQQIECITNQLCSNKDLFDIMERMWGQPAYVKWGKDIEPCIENRIDSESNYTVAKLVLGKDAVKKSKSFQAEATAIDKLKAIVYFLGYEAKMKSSDFNNYVDFTYLLTVIYQCRNLNHRGSVMTQWQASIIEKVLAQQSVYYFKFLGALVQFVNYIRDNYAHLPEMKKTVEKLPIKVVMSDRINISAYLRNRFKK